MDQLKRLFTDFVHVNLNVGKKTVSWRDIEERNITMIARSFLKMCRYNYLIPTMFNIEQLQKFMEQTLPPITNGEQDFYVKELLRKAYDDDKNYQTTMVEPLIDSSGEMCEPALHFHEFIFLMGLIAHNCIDSSDSISGKLQDFYIQKLNFRKPSEAQANRDITYDEVLKRVEEDVGERVDPGGSSEEDQFESGEEYESEDDTNQAMMGLIERKNQQQEGITIDWDHILDVLGTDLPKIPVKA